MKISAYFRFRKASSNANFEGLLTKRPPSRNFYPLISYEGKNVGAAEVAIRTSV
jgi:hypothetical protein